VDTTLIVTMAIFILISTWNNIFTYFINATNELNLQIITSIIGMLISVWPKTHFFTGSNH